MRNQNKIRKSKFKQLGKIFLLIKDCNKLEFKGNLNQNNKGTRLIKILITNLINSLKFIRLIKVRIKKIIMIQLIMD